MWHYIVGSSPSSLCGKRCRHAVWNFLNTKWIRVSQLLLSLVRLVPEQLRLETGLPNQWSSADGSAFPGSVWLLWLMGTESAWTQRSLIQEQHFEESAGSGTGNAACLVEQTSAHQPLIINSFAETLANVLHGGNWFFCVCLCAPAGQSVVVTPESGSQGGNYCSGRQTLRSGRTCHTLSVQRLFGGKAQSLSLHHCCSSQCVFGNTIDGQIPPQLRFFIMQILHQVLQSSATIWKTLILISGLVYGVRLMKALWCQAAS